MSIKKIFKNSLLFILSLIILTAIFIGAILENSKPPMDGDRRLKNLSAKVSISRDQFGIPHIQAANELDALRALGYTIASERLFQMDLQRRLASGTLSEILGEKTYNVDLTMRTLKLRETMKTLEVDPAIQKKVEAYFEGVNAYIDDCTLPIEFHILRYKPDHFTWLDAYAFVGYMSYSFETAVKQDPLMSKLQNLFPKEVVEELRYHGNEKISGKSFLSSSNSFIPEVEKFLQQGFAPLEGSNAWLISKEKSKSGFPILANDPHIAFSQPEVWYEAHIKTPEYEMYGHHLPLLPFPVLGHNRNFGWGLTMSIHDDLDFYKEKIEGEKYFFKNEWLPLLKREEEIKVKGESSRRVTFFETHHGPILDPIFEEKGLSMKWTFYTKGNDPLKVIHNMGHAQNMEDFKKSIAMGICPGLNIMYADKTNIMWWIHGEFWKRPAHVKSDFVLDGSSGKDEVERVLRFEEKPHLVNPPEGFIASANAQPVGFSGAGDWQPDDRFKSIVQKLKSQDKWDAESIQKLQTWNSNVEDVKIREALFISIDDEVRNKFDEYLQIVNRWNLLSEIDSVGATIFHTWNIENLKIMTSKFSAEDQEAYSKLATSWMLYKRVMLEPLRDSSQKSKNSWLQYIGKTRAEIVKQGLANTIERLRTQLGPDSAKWTWGRIHTLKYNHPLGKIKILDHFFSLGPYPAPGNAQDVNNMKASGFADGFDVILGPSTRRIVDFAHPENAYGILPVGNSGHQLSPFYKDQVQMFLNGVYRPAIMDEARISEQKSHHLILIPQ